MSSGTAIKLLRSIESRPFPRLFNQLRHCPHPQSRPLPPISRVSMHHSSDSLSFHRICPLSRRTVYLWSPYSSGSGNRVSFACWNCSEPSQADVPFLCCGVCRAVQPVDLSVNYFQIFGLEKGYDLMDEDLEGTYKSWQKKLHPDLVHSKSEKEKYYAVEQSARMIDAYHTLRKPLSRALYLLKLAGIFVDEERTVMDTVLLSEMMDVREACEEATDPKALMEIQYQIKKKQEDCSNSFREAFNKRDFDSAIDATLKMRYYERAIEEIVKKL